MKAVPLRSRGRCAAPVPAGWPCPAGCRGSVNEWGSGGHHLQGLHSFRVQGCPLDSPPHFWGTEMRLSQRGRGGPPLTTHQHCLLTIQDVELVCGLAET